MLMVGSRDSGSMGWVGLGFVIRVVHGLIVLGLLLHGLGWVENYGPISITDPSDLTLPDSLLKPTQD